MNKIIIYWSIFCLLFGLFIFKLLKDRHDGFEQVIDIYKFGIPLSIYFVFVLISTFIYLSKKRR